MGEFGKVSTKAYVVDELGAPFKLQDIILDELHADEVLVEIKYTGICHTVGETTLNQLSCR
jgi:Zn-dependent alcohol dehydrogenase